MATINQINIKIFSNYTCKTLSFIDINPIFNTKPYSKPHVGYYYCAEVLKECFERYSTVQKKFFEVQKWSLSDIKMGIFLKKSLHLIQFYFRPDATSQTQFQVFCWILNCAMYMRVYQIYRTMPKVPTHEPLLKTKAPNN